MTETTPFEDLTHLDCAVHEPTRLAILTALSACERADFVFLLRITGLTNGNLSAHLSKLEAARLIEIEKRFVGKKAQTLGSLTRPGRDAIDAYWRTMETVRHRVASWVPEPA